MTVSVGSKPCIEAAQRRWRAVNAPQLVALVRAVARFERGHLVERPAEPTATTAQAAAAGSRFLIHKVLTIAPALPPAPQRALGFVGLMAG